MYPGICQLMQRRPHAYKAPYGLLSVFGFNLMPGPHWNPIQVTYQAFRVLFFSLPLCLCPRWLPVLL